MIKQVAHIGLTVSNLENSIKFYNEILGFEYVGVMKMEGETTEKLFNRKGCCAMVGYLKSDDNTPLVELIQFLDVPSKQQTTDLFTTSISELCFNVDDIDEEYNRLKNNGVKFISEPQFFDSTKYGFSKSKAVYFYDPDGNIIELIQDL